MHFTVLTLFPDLIREASRCSILGRAAGEGLIGVDAIDIRDYAFNKHKKVDDYPYGGGAGMLMQAEPVYLAYEAALSRIRERNENAAKARVVYMNPQGKTLDQGMAESFSKEEELIILCGHYEGIDERVLEEIVTDHVSVGDYVLTGGELPALILIDAVARLVPGVLHNDSSAQDESFQGHLLEYPQYSRPEVWHGKKVPEVLLTGHHENVEKWRHEQSVKRTLAMRPDLYEKFLREE
ncbi:MAG: tRNA (guanosine(37)-N1)-methyltransferase TrmD [Lachnospiraceae bacterium]|nr:tRNA (guanosine(37)-N1)-methyltransferase TrmD [Lachnospiraceae bacterium]